MRLRKRRPRSILDCRLQHCEPGDIEAEDRVSCVSGEPFGTCERTSMSSFARAQLTRDRFRHQMENRKPGSCGYESLETRSPVLDRLRRRREALSEAPRHDEPPGCEAA